jgi:hypothetical protein
MRASFSEYTQPTHNVQPHPAQNYTPPTRNTQDTAMYLSPSTGTHPMVTGAQQ